MSLLSLYRENMRSLFLLFILLMTSLLSSCSAGYVDFSQVNSSASARLLLYLHLDSHSSADIDFVISDISLETYGGKSINLDMGAPIVVASKALANDQLLLAELFVEPGSYRELRLKTSKAFVGRAGDRASLALGESDGIISIKEDFLFRNMESYVVSLEWDPMNSIEKGFHFYPDIKAEFQVSSPRNTLLFVSNSGANYISIIDRSLERIVGAVTTGMRPMGMTLNSEQDLLYVVNSGSQSVSIVETSRFRLISTFPLSGGVGPSDIVFVPDALSIDGKLYITNRLSNDITVVSTATKRILKLIPVGNRPSSIVADVERKEVYVTNELSNDMTIINAVDDTVVATVDVSRKPSGITVGKDKLYIFNEGSSSISIVSPSLRKVVRTISLADPPKRGVSGLGGRTFVASKSAGSITFLTPFDVVNRTIASDSGPIGLVVDEVRNRVYIANYSDDDISLVDPLGERILKKLSVGKKPYEIVLADR